MKEEIVVKMDHISRWIELVMSAIVLVVVVVGIVSLYEPFLELLHGGVETEEFLEFLADVLNLVIGIEFFRVLCMPEKSTLLEVLMFVMARHMIVHESSSLENLLTVVGIVAVILVEEYIHHSRCRCQNHVETHAHGEM